MSQHEEIISWTQIHDIDSLYQFYTNCYGYLPELFIIAGISAAIFGWYIATHLEELKYKYRILIIAGKMYLYNKKNL